MRNFVHDCIGLVKSYYFDESGEVLITDDIFVVWSCKTLQNKKAILGTNVDNTLFEVTLNGDKQEMYVDAYKKVKNFKVKC